MDGNHTSAISRRSRITVIVAENYSLARAALAGLLIYDGYRALQADCLESALSHINYAYGPVVLLVDVDMPGWETIVRQAIKRADAFVIAMVGNHHPLSKIHEVKGRGIQICLLKPILYHDVRTAIIENLGMPEPMPSASNPNLSLVDDLISRERSRDRPFE